MKTHFISLAITGVILAGCLEQSKLPSSNSSSSASGASPAASAPKGTSSYFSPSGSAPISPPTNPGVASTPVAVSTPNAPVTQGTPVLSKFESDKAQTESLIKQKFENKTRRYILGAWLVPKTNPTAGPTRDNWMPLGYTGELPARTVSEDQLPRGTDFFSMERVYQRDPEQYTNYYINPMFSAENSVYWLMEKYQTAAKYAFASNKKDYLIRTGVVGCDNPEQLNYMISPLETDARSSRATSLWVLSAFYPLIPMMEVGVFSYQNPTTARSPWNFNLGTLNFPRELMLDQGIPPEWVDRAFVDIISADGSTPYPGENVWEAVTFLPAFNYNMPATYRPPFSSYGSFLWNKRTRDVGPAFGNGTKLGSLLSLTKELLKMQAPKNVDLATFQAKVKSQFSAYAQLEAAAKATTDTQRLSSCASFGLKVDANRPSYPWELFPMNTSCRALHQRLKTLWSDVFQPSSVISASDFNAKKSLLASNLWRAARFEAAMQEMQKPDANGILAYPATPGCFSGSNTKSYLPAEWIKPIEMGTLAFE